MREISFEESKAIQLDILTAVDSFCDINGINYFLAFGSLIGAIRHKGFIPWDDDIDIAMPRPDYNRFVTTFNGSCQHLHVFSPELDLNYYAPYANVCDDRTILIEERASHRGQKIGVKIDVFPIDGVPTDEKKYREYSAKLQKYNMILGVKRTKLNSLKGFRQVSSYLFRLLLYSAYSFSSIQKRIIDFVNKYPYEDAIKVDHSTFSAYSLKRFDKKALTSFVKVDFENHLFSIPSGYDNYLRSIYGDYMQLPPKEKRIPHHGFVAYWK